MSLDQPCSRKPRRRTIGGEERGVVTLIARVNETVHQAGTSVPHGRVREHPACDAGRTDARIGEERAQRRDRFRVRNIVVVQKSKVRFADNNVRQRDGGDRLALEQAPRRLRLVRRCTDEKAKHDRRVEPDGHAPERRRVMLARTADRLCFPSAFAA